MNVLDAAFNLVHDQPGGAGPLALRLGKRPGTLSHEIRHEGFAKLGLVDALKISQITGDLRILNAFADELGCMVLPLAQSTGSDDAVMRCVATLAREFSDVVASAVDADSDGKITANELAKFEGQWAELIAAGHGLLGHLRGRYEAGVPAHMRTQAPSAVNAVATASQGVAL